MIVPSDGRHSLLPSGEGPGEGSYFDANSFLGEWPSRRLNGSPPPERDALVSQRLRLMDRLGIKRAAVSLLEGVWLKDSGVANAELHALLRGHEDRFLPLYTLNPTFPTWEEHLSRCVNEYGLRPGAGAVRLLPAYHGYALEDAAPLLDAPATLEVAVVLTVQLEDMRMQHPGMRVPDVSPADVVGAIRRWPRQHWIVANCVYNQARAIGADVPAEARVWFDLARVQGPIDCVRLLCDQLGAHRLVFGTNLPLHVPHSPILELADARLTPDVDAAVRAGNARTAFGL